MAGDSGKRQENTARVVLSGELRDLSDDPSERYQHHFIHVIERSLDTSARPVVALDLACGRGDSTLTLLRKLPPGSRAVGVCEDREALKLFHEQLTRELRRVVFPRKEKRDRLPFAQNVFDVAWASLAHEPLKPARPILRAALQVLRPGGLLLLAVPLRATFSELIRTVSPALAGHETDPAFAALVSEPPELFGAEAWSEDMRRCGAMEVEVHTDTIETTLTPPLSRQALFTRHLLPMWLGHNAPLEEPALRLLDATVTDPFKLTVHIGCVRGRRGMSEIEDSLAPA